MSQESRRSMVRVILLSLAIVVATNFYAALPHDIVLPFKDLGDGGISVPVHVFGQVRRFLFDTGCDFGCLDSRLTNFLSGPVAQAMIRTDHANNAAAVLVYPGPDLYFREVPIRPKFIGGCDLSELSKHSGEVIEGIAGRDLFLDRSITIDFQTTNIFISQRPRRSKTTITVPFEKSQSGNYFFAAKVIGSQEINLAIDTGASDSVFLNPDDWKKAFPDGQVKFRASSRVDFAGIVSESVTATLPFLKIGSELFTNLTCQRMGNTNVASCLGLDFLRRRQVTIDYRRELLIIEKSASP